LRIVTGPVDIHSPRVPEIGEMTDLIKLARSRLSDTPLWINPDCGLEVRPALANMVAAARELRTLA
jgi:5-methyltetrahydropteroyltriglutamate--homocysteine methyltransferase